jgi:hypothetical protein
MKKKTIIISILFLPLVLFIMDRYLWMSDRAKHDWRWESGILLGDPISFDYDFEINDSSIIFKKEKAKNKFQNVNRSKNRSFYFFGCYLGKLYIYDTTKNEMAVYTDE